MGVICRCQDEDRDDNPSHSEHFTHGIIDSIYGQLTQLIINETKVTRLSPYNNLGAMLSPSDTLIHVILAKTFYTQFAEEEVKVGK